MEGSQIDIFVFGSQCWMGKGKKVLPDRYQRDHGAAGEAIVLPHRCDMPRASPWVGGDSPFGFPPFFGVSLLFYQFPSVFYFGELKIR